MEIRLNQNGGFMPSKAMCNGRDIEGPPNMNSFFKEKKVGPKRLNFISHKYFLNCSFEEVLSRYRDLLKVTYKGSIDRENVKYQANYRDIY